MPDFGVFKEFYLSHGFLAGICWNSISIFSSIQYMGRLMLCFNRFSYYFSPRYFDKIWQRPWYLFLIVFLPITLCSRHFTTNSAFIFDRNNSVNVSINEPGLLFAIKSQNIILDSVTCSLSWILSLASFTKLSLMKSSHIPVSINRNEVLLFYHSIVLILAQVAKFAVTLFQLYYSNDPEFGKFLTDMLIPIADIFALLGPISLFLINSNFRVIYQSFYGCSCGYEEEPQFRRRYSVSPAVQTLQVHPFKNNPV